MNHENNLTKNFMDMSHNDIAKMLEDLGYSHPTFYYRCSNTYGHTLWSEVIDLNKNIPFTNIYFVEDRAMKNFAKNKLSVDVNNMKFTISKVVRKPSHSIKRLDTWIDKTSSVKDVSRDCENYLLANEPEVYGNMCVNVIDRKIAANNRANAGLEFEKQRIIKAYLKPTNPSSDEMGK